MMDIAISPAQPDHFEELRAIELAAFETLRKAGAVTGQAAAGSLAEFTHFYRHGLLLAAFTPNKVPVGFVAGTFEERWLHIAGVGRLLMKTILSAGQALDLRGATLTTDIAAAFNARFYATLGFDIADTHSQPPHLARRLADEIAGGFDPGRRTAMWMSWPEK